MNYRILAFVPLLAMAGCASTKLPSPAANPDNVVALRDSGIQQVGVGTFKLEIGKPPAMNKSASARGSEISTEVGSFSGYVRQGLQNDLQAAGKYDANAPVKIEGELLNEELHAAGVSHADARVSVRFRAKHDDKVLFDKVVDQHEEWKSSFVGAVAIPDAINHFTAQFQLILLKLYKDPEFRAALKETPH